MEARRQPPEPPPVQARGQLASDHQRARLPLFAANGKHQAVVQPDPLAASAVEVVLQLASAAAADHSQARLAEQ